MHFVVIILIFILTSCSNLNTYSLTASDLLFKDNYDLKDKMMLSEKQINEDLSLLLYALTSSYGGRKYIDQKIFNEALAEIEKLKLRHNEMNTSLALRDAIDEIFLKIPDGHLKVTSQNSGYSFARNQSEKRGSVGQNFLQNFSPVWAIQYVNISNQSIPLISISSFPNPNDKAWDGFKDAIDNVMNSKNIIIDVRGNQGGDDTMAKWLAVKISGNSVISPYFAQIKSNTSEALAILANMEKLHIYNLKSKGKEVQEYRMNRLKEKMEKFRESLVVPSEMELKNYFSTEINPISKPFLGNVYVLQDAECFSSCEDFVSYFDSISNVMTVGENTAGSIHFGNMGIIVLPNSQLVVQMASDFWQLRNGKNLEKIGHTPKLLLNENTDALEKALNLITKKKTPESFILLSKNVSKKLSKDQKLILNNQNNITMKMKEIREYWGLDSYKTVKIMIGRYDENSNFQNCARIYGPELIYIHERSSFNNVADKKLEIFCKNMTDLDLIQTVSHEYAHAIHLKLYNKNKTQLNWIWEGLAIYLSGELSKKKILEHKKINICLNDFTMKEAYSYGGHVISYLEMRKPKIGHSLAAVKNLEELRNLLEANHISCEINL